MSQLSRHLTLKATDESRAIKGDFMPRVKRWDELPVEQPLSTQMDMQVDNLRMARVYRLETRIAAEVAFEDPAFAGPAIEGAREYLVDHVYGEYRMPLRKLRYLIANNETGNAMQLLDQIEKSMFATWGHEEPSGYDI